MNNNNNCGYCGHVCGEGWKCVNGQCVQTCGDSGTICSPNQKCCDGSCVDVTSDPGNCGSCGHECDEGDICISGSCTKIECDPPCQEGETCCRTASGNKCFNLNTDKNNCGQCGKVCTGIDEVCVDGVCSQPQCDPPCEAGKSCCGDVCVDKLTDMQNCGYCGNYRMDAQQDNVPVEEHSPAGLTRSAARVLVAEI